LRAVAVQRCHKRAKRHQHATGLCIMRQGRAVDRSFSLLTHDAAPEVPCVSELCYIPRMGHGEAANTLHDFISPC
jgi:hypothetical protein